MDFLTGSLLGGMLYGLVKYKAQITADSIKEKAKEKLTEWIYEDSTADDIANRINELGYVKDESESDYGKRLEADDKLTELLQAPTVQITQTVTGSTDSRFAANDFNETTNNHYYAATPTIEDKPQPIFALPSHGQQLIGRENIIAQLLETLAQPTPPCRLLIKGMGGIGKTSICRTVAHYSKNLVNDVIWIDAQVGITNDLQAKVLPKLNINPKRPHWLDLVIDKLNQTVSPAILFIDNVEASPDSAATLRQLSKLNWHIVITSRDLLPGFERLDIDLMSTEQCTQLFLKHYQMTVSDEEQATLTKLIELSGNHTLTVELLAKIAADSDLPLARIYQQVADSGFNLNPLTNTKIDSLHSGTEKEADRQHQLHEHLGKLFTLTTLKDEEKDLLRILAILPYKGYLGREELMVWFGLDEAKILTDLVKKGWLQRQDKSYSLHPVMAFVVQETTKNQDLLSHFVNRFIQFIYPGENQHWIEKSQYVGHLIKLINSSGIERLQTYQLLTTLAHIFEAKGEYQQALPLFKKAEFITKTHYGEKHPSAISALNKLASIYERTGNTEKAQNAYVTLLQIINDVKTNDVDIASTLNNMAIVLTAQGNLDEALLVLQRSLKLNTNTSDSNTLQIANILCNIADVYKEKTEYKKALDHYLRAKVIYENEAATNSEEFGQMLNGLALVYHDMEQYEQALPLFNQSLTILKNKLGENHPVVAATLNNKALLYKSTSKLELALQLFSRALLITEKSYGPTHPNVATTLLNIADLYHDMERYEEVLPKLIRVYDIYKQTSNPENVSRCLPSLLRLCTVTQQKYGRWAQVKIFKELQHTYQWSETEITTRLGIAKLEFRRKMRAMAFASQYQDSDFGDQFSESMFDLFIEAIKNESLKSWCGWDNAKMLGTNTQRCDLLFSWLSKDPDSEKDEQPPIATIEDIQLLGRLISSEKGIDVLTTTRNLQQAYNDSGLEQIDKAFAAVNTVDSAIAALYSVQIQEDQLPTLEASFGRLQGIIEKHRQSGLAGVEQTTLLSENIERHFSSLHIKKYKCLENLELSKLSRVNLIAGINNSGKTSLLEAIYLLTKQNDFAGILEVIRRRGKVAEDHIQPQWFIEQLNGPIQIAGEFDNKASSVSIIHKDEDASDLDRAHYLRTVEIDAHFNGKDMDSATRLFKSRDRTTQADDIKILCRTVFSSPFFLNESHVYARYYRQAVQSKSFKAILDFLRSEVVDTLEDVRLVDQRQRFTVEDSQFETGVDLTSYGEGVQRMFFISLLFASAKNGVVLIDEFENAIHTKLIARFAPFIHKLAIEFNVQVFITSHSKECIDAFVNNVPKSADFAYHALVAAEEEDEGKIAVRQYSGIEFKRLVAAGNVDLRWAQ